MCIGERIKARRTELGMSQLYLASAIDTTPQLIYKYEKGIVSNIPYDKLAMIANVLETTTTYLLGFEETPATVIDDGLSEQEQRLLELFRRIPDNEKGTVASMIEFMAKSKESSK